MMKDTLTKTLDIAANNNESDLIRTVDRDGNPFEYHIRDLYPDEESYRYSIEQSEQFARCLPELIAKYAGKYVIFEDGLVIDTDRNEDKLLDRIWNTEFVQARMGENGRGIYCHLIPELAVILNS